MAIRNEGSDTMVNIAEAWAEQYHVKNPNVRVQVLGGGSGVGIASLIDGNCDMANTSRKMKKAEIDQAESKQGKKPEEIVVGNDALAIYVHKRNPLDSISLEELADLYGEDGKITRWSQLGVPEGMLGTDKIIRDQPAKRLGHLRLLSRGRLGQGQGLEARLGRRQRLEGRREPHFAHARRHRLQRHGLCHRQRQDAENIKAARRVGRGPHGRKRLQRRLSHHPAAANLRDRQAGRARSRSISTGSSRPKDRRLYSIWATCRQRCMSDAKVPTN